MNADERRSELAKITRRIIGCAYRVSNALGSGFLEKAYENALAHELQKDGLSARQQHPIQVRYDGVLVGDFVADFLVENAVLVELKAVQAIDGVHMAQCMNYLRATGLRVCLLIYFGKPRLEIKRVVHKY